MTTLSMKLGMALPNAHTPPHTCECERPYIICTLLSNMLQLDKKNRRKTIGFCAEKEVLVDRVCVCRFFPEDIYALSLKHRLISLSNNMAAVSKFSFSVAVMLARLFFPSTFNIHHNNNNSEAQSAEKRIKKIKAEKERERTSVCLRKKGISIKMKGEKSRTQSNFPSSTSLHFLSSYFS